jgi:hypothetical protein
MPIKLFVLSEVISVENIAYFPFIFFAVSLEEVLKKIPEIVNGNIKEVVKQDILREEHYLLFLESIDDKIEFTLILREYNITPEEYYPSSIII